MVLNSLPKNITQYVRGKGTSQPVVIKPCGKNGKGQLRQIVGFIADNAETLTRNYQYDALNRLIDAQGFGIVASASNFRNPGNLMAASMLVDMAKKLNNPQAQKALLRNAELMGAALPESASWAFDENGNIASKTIHTTTQDKLISYTYDEADRLTSLTRPVDDDAAHSWPGHFHWHYPTHAGAGRMPQTETVSLTYDANGNLINDSTGRQLTWNALDQLTQLKTPDTTASFAYDPLGRRTSYTKNSTLKTYLLNGLDVLSDGSSNFLHGVGMDEHLQVDAPTGSMSYLQDHLGSTSQLIDSSNAISKARLDYKSYGKLEGDSANTISANPYTYTGREDDGTGLYYYRNRYYDPELEIFVSQDPLGDAQRYVSGNPMSFTDPLGLWTLNLVSNAGQHPISSLTVSLKTNLSLGGITKNISTISPESFNTAITQSILEAKTKYPGQAITNVNIFAHGSEGGIGPGGAGGELVIDNEALARAFSPLQNQPVTITLYSCHTGNGEFTIGNRISKILPNAIVKAPNAYIVPAIFGDWFSSELVGPIYGANDALHFNTFINGNMFGGAGK